jgi:hypothetical protein
MRTIVYATATVLTLATSCTALAGFFSQTLKNPQAIDAFDRYKTPCQKTGTCKSDDKNPPRPRVHAAKDHTGPMKDTRSATSSVPPGRSRSLVANRAAPDWQRSICVGFDFRASGAGLSRAFSR